MTLAEQTEVARESYNFWLTKPMASKTQALALLSMQAGESGFNIRAIGDHGEAYGSFQDHPARIAEIKAGTGIDVRTASNIDQLEGAYWEMTKGWYRKVWPELTAATSLLGAVSILVKDFEGSLNQQSDIVKRYALAQLWELRLAV